MQRSLFLLFFLIGLYAQAQLRSRIVIDGKPFYKNYKDTLELTRHITELQNQYLSQGYFFSGLDSIFSKRDTVSVFLHKGSRIESRVEFYGSEKKNPSKFIFNTINEYANNGFPFVQVRLDSVSIEKSTLVGRVNINEGPEITYDTAFFFNPISTNKSYIFQLLEIKPGDLFSESSYKSISRKVERSPFLKIQRAPDISFKKNMAKVFLDLKENETNTFQGVLGLQQGQGNTTVVIGSLDLSIENLFSSGKELDFLWERYDENSQRLNMLYKHPFFLDSKITPSFTFGLLKQDTIFLTRNTGLGLNTFISSSINLSLAFQKTTGTLLTTSQLEISNQGLADFEKAMYKIELSQGHIDKLGSYEEGFVWKVNLGAGEKQVNKNLSIQDSFYDTIQLKTSFLQTEVNLAYQKKVWKRQAIFHSISMGLIQNDELLTNELYRLGGLSSVRGFNEKSFFADYSISSQAEFRSFFEDRSYLYFFYDQLFYGRRGIKDYPFGIGIGFALATSSGQFSFVLATGQSKSQDIGATSIKAHFGYISRF